MSCIHFVLRVIPTHNFVKPITDRYTYIPELSIYYGSFLTHKVKMPLANPNPNQKYVEVLKTEEKGSDVNLAVHLLNDAWLNNYDCAVIVSNDSDLAESIRIVKRQLNKIIGIAIPPNCHPSKELLKLADFKKSIRMGALKVSQLPKIIPDTNIRKPSNW